ncbi:hypothetical protein J8273_7907 [Carpediemonas membranifera]|uniref:Uncharacterized protein n=1 Tax=Carpediemonas membranifera TaxID=201153 RepID=A0A8J6APV5_9EUKA|nr:hypothetical protein J8273_7907 [Carpediemonas membranifera]|eukprot:KAG9390556.1 hypothetical protein J8273_7907 [Carpediemonas membranifera]
MSCDLARVQLDPNLIDDQDDALLVPIKKSILDTLFRFDPHRSTIELPPTSFRSGNYRNMVDLMKRFDDENEDLYALSIGPNGSRVRLNTAQLRELRQTGKFSVPSIKYPSKSHVWRISGFWQMGRDRIVEIRHRIIDETLDIWLVFIPDRFNGEDTASMTGGVRSMGGAVLDALNVTVGLHDKHKAHSAWSLSDKMKHYEIEQTLDRLITPTPEMQARTATFKDGSPFIVEKDVHVLDRLDDVYRKFLRRWNADRESRRADIASRIPEGDIRSMQEAEQLMKQDAVCELVQENLALNPDFTVATMRILAAVRKAMADADAAQWRAADEFEAELRRAHPIKARATRWVGRKVTAFIEQWERDHTREDLLLEVGRAVSDMADCQQALFFRTRMDVHTDPGTAAYEMGLRAKVRPREFRFSLPIWRKKSMSVVKTRFGFNLVQSRTVGFDAVHVGWRFQLAAYTLAFLWLNGINVSWRRLMWGSFGLRSLFGVKKFSHTFEANHAGTIVPRAPWRKTWIGRVADQIRHIREDRAAFERRPDRGFFGKSFARIFNVLHNYLVKGAIGIPLILVLHPFLAALNTVLCTAVILTSVVWAPLLTGLQYAVNVLVHDYNAPNDRRSSRRFPLAAAVVRLVIRGAGQVVLSIVAIPYGIVMSGLFVLYANAFVVLRTLYDAAMFFVIIRPRANVPAFDTFVAIRVAGPGMSRRHKMMIPNHVALIFLKAYLERRTMQFFETYVERQIAQPNQVARDFFARFHGVGLAYDTVSEVATEIEESSLAIRKYFQSLKQGRTREQTALDAPSLWNTRVDPEFKEILIAQAAAVVSAFIDKTRPWMTDDEYEALFAAHDCSEGDFRRLADKMLRAAITPDFLEDPLDEDSRGFHLEVSKHTLATVLDGLFDGDLKHELERIETCAPSGKERGYLEYEELPVVSPENYTNRTDMRWWFVVDSAKFAAWVRKRTKKDGDDMSVVLCE